MTYVVKREYEFFEEFENVVVDECVDGFTLVSWIKLVVNIERVSVVSSIETVVDKKLEIVSVTDVFVIKVLVVSSIRSSGHFLLYSTEPDRQKQA